MPMYGLATRLLLLAASSCALTVPATVPAAPSAAAVQLLSQRLAAAADDVPTSHHLIFPSSVLLAGEEEAVAESPAASPPSLFDQFGSLDEPKITRSEPPSETPFSLPSFDALPKLDASELPKLDASALLQLKLPDLSQFKLPDASALKLPASTEELEARLQEAAPRLEEQLATLKAGITAGIPDAKGLEEKLTKDVAPALQRGLDAAEPVLKKTAEDLAPVLKSAGDSAAVKLSTLLERGVNAASGEASGFLSNLAPAVQQTAGVAQRELQEAVTSAGKTIEQEVTKQEPVRELSPILSRASSEVAPQLQRSLQETARGLQAAKPVLKKTAEDLAPVLKSASESAASQLAPVVTPLVTEAEGTIVSSLRAAVDSLVVAITPLSEGVDVEDAAVVGGLVLVPLLLLKLAETAVALALPALALFVVLVGLGLSSELAATFPGLGTPGEIFVRLSAVAVAGTGTIALYLKVSSAVRSVTDGVTKQVDELKGKVDETVQPLVSKLPELPKLAELPKGEAAVAVPAQQEATKAPLGLPTLGFGGVGKAKAGDAAKAASEADDKAAVKRGSGDPFTVRTGDKDVVIRNPFRTPDEFSAVPPNQRNDEES